MSIVLHRRLIRAAGAGAVLVAAVGLTGLVRHRRAMAETFFPPVFAFDVGGELPIGARPLAITMPLGAFQADEGNGPPRPPPPRRIEDELRRLGRIRSAIVVYPPYDRIRPALVFEFKDARDGERIRTIELGEALVVVKQEGMGELKRPFRFRFIGVERDPKDPEVPLFLFDVDCDGRNIQKLRWVGDEKDEPETPDAKATQQPARTSVRLFEREADVNAPTAKGRAHIAKHWESFGADVRTQPYVDPKTGRHEGVRVLGFRPGSVVNQFRLVADDVVVAINGRPVSHKAETIRVIRDELRKKKTRIVVRLLRQGRVFDETYDTRDPETRAQAKAAAKDR